MKRVQSLEVNIVSASDVRRYAENNASSQERARVEQLLLDDERARSLVAACSDDLDAVDLSAAAEAELCGAVEICEEAVIVYELLGDAARAPKTLRDFAQARFSSRWSILSDMRAALGEAALVKDKPIETPESQRSPRELLEEIENREAAAVSRLRRAFAAPAAPNWKAKIAEWITTLQFDLDRIAWLGEKKTAA